MQFGLIAALTQCSDSSSAWSGTYLGGRASDAASWSTLESLLVRCVFPGCRVSRHSRVSMAYELLLTSLSFFFRLPRVIHSIVSSRVHVLGGVACGYRSSVETFSLALDPSARPGLHAHWSLVPGDSGAYDDTWAVRNFANGRPRHSFGDRWAKGRCGHPRGVEGFCA